MDTSVIQFHFADIQYALRDRYKLRSWLTQSIRAEKKELGEISFVYCSDKYLLGLNKKFLNHDTYTDIITFDYTQGNLVSGEIYISLDRVRENARNFHSGIKNELHRVMIHGVLHLMGYKDKSARDKSVMTSKEDYYLTLRAF